MSTKTRQSLSLNEAENYANKELLYTKWLLRTLGLWPMVLHSSTKMEKIMASIVMTVSFFTITLSSVAMLMFMGIKLPTWPKRFVLFGPMGFRISNYFKYLFLIYRSNIIKKCLDSMKLDWSETTDKEDHMVMIESTSLARHSTNICGVLMCSAGLFFQVIKPLVEPKHVNEFNVTIRTLVLPGYDFFVNTQVTPIYQIVIGLQISSALFLYMIVTASSNLAAVFVSHICGQVKVIQLKFRRIEEDKHSNDYEIDRQMASIIACHVRIMKFTGKVDQVLSEICLIEVVHSTIIICWLQFSCVAEWEDKEPIKMITHTLLLISLTFNIFILCFIGQILKNQYEFVGKITYMSDWYKLPKRTMLSLILIITMAEKSCSMTAGGMMEMTYRTFLDILKTSVAYFQMLRTVMGRA